MSGGLAEEVDEKVLHAAFIPFGDITDIQIPLDYETGKMQCFCLVYNITCELSVKMDDNVSSVMFSEKHRGFAFIEFELAEVCTGYVFSTMLINENTVQISFETLS